MDGAATLECGIINGNCSCKDGFTGLKCDECIPNVIGDKCDSCREGYTGIKCDECLPNVIGDKCDACQPNFYDYPSCQEGWRKLISGVFCNINCIFY